MARRLTGRPPPPRRSALIAATALQQPVKIHGRNDRDAGRTWCGRPCVTVSTATRLAYVTCAACRARAPER